MQGLSSFITDVGSTIYRIAKNPAVGITGALLGTAGIVWAVRQRNVASDLHKKIEEKSELLLQEKTLRLKTIAQLHGRIAKRASLTGIDWKASTPIPIIAAKEQSADFTPAVIEKKIFEAATDEKISTFPKNVFASVEKSVMTSSLVTVVGAEEPEKIVLQIKEINKSNVLYFNDHRITEIRLTQKDTDHFILLYGTPYQQDGQTKISYLLYSMHDNQGKTKYEHHVVTLKEKEEDNENVVINDKVNQALIDNVLLKTWARLDELLRSK